MSTTRLCAVLVGTLICGLAHADNKLFPTDLLAPRQADATLSLNGYKMAGDLRANGVPGSMHVYGLDVSAAARYGITHALTLGAQLSGGSSNAITSFNNNVRFDGRESGLDRTTVFARLALVPEGRGPYTVTTDLSVAHDQNHHGDTSYNVYGVKGTVSARTTDLVRTYASAGISLPSKGYANRTLALSAGGWMLMNPGVTATLDVGIERSMASSTVTGANATSLAGSVIWELAPRTSLRTSLMFGRTTAAGSTDGLVSTKPSQAQALGVTLYHLY
ncbi:MAG: hypothetical protein RI907_3820 [Pseudomonadota bacterium]|jgi:hypothetical protein